MNRPLTSKVLLAVGLVCASLTFAQGTFQNLDFEGARNIPVFDPAGHPWTMSADDALPGWSCYLGTNQITYATFNELALDSAAVGILSSTSSYAPARLLVGQYCVSLQYGVTSSGPQPEYSSASIGQSGQLPVGAQSIRFRGSLPFTVTFAGNAVPLVVLSAQAGYNLYGGDISQFAGQTGELRITTDSHFSYLDAIQFSPIAIPEPNTVCLIAVGLGMCWMWSRRRLRMLTTWSDENGPTHLRTGD